MPNPTPTVSVTPKTPLGKSNTVLTQAAIAPGSRATPGGANDVVISVRDNYANIWSDRFVKAQPNRRKTIIMPLNPTTEQIVRTIDSAARLAGENGILIFNVGHGTAGNFPTVGSVDLAPNKKMRLGGQGQTDIFINVFYDVNLAGPNGFSDMDNDIKVNAGTAGAKQRMANWQTYQKIGTIIRSARIRRVIFLTCNVGNATDFIKKIANDWGTVIEAYRRRVILAPQPNGNVRIYLEGDAPGTETNIPESEQALPRATESNSYRAGPPLAASSP